MSYFPPATQRHSRSLSTAGPKTPSADGTPHHHHHHPTTTPLRETWTIWGLHRPPSSKIVDYEKDLQKIGSFASVESFWSVYTHLHPPSALPTVSDYHLFRSGIRPVWEAPENIRGGKWIIRLRKGVADRLWEDCVLAIIGDVLAEGTTEICGAVLSVRAAEDILSVWIRRESDPALVNKIRDEICKVLNLPLSCEMQFKSNSESLQDKTSFRQPAERGA